jgi:hypothetical protein
VVLLIPFEYNVKTSSLELRHRAGFAMPRRRMSGETGNRQRAIRRTRPVTLRMDIDLWARLMHHAPKQHRSVGNLLQALVAEGLDRLDDEDGVLEAISNLRRLLHGLTSTELRQVLIRQRAFLDRQRGLLVRMPPAPRSLHRPRGRRRKPT